MCREQRGPEAHSRPSSYPFEAIHAPQSVARWSRGTGNPIRPVIPAVAQDKVDVKVVKYDDLTATIKKLKGKVIVIDFWADW